MRVNTLQVATGGSAMRQKFLKAVPKKATNTTLSLDAYNSISHTGEQLLREAIRVESECQWAKDHADFIAAYNQTVEKEGLPLSQWRNF
jgi:antitoxin CcdA